MNDFAELGRRLGQAIEQTFAQWASEQVEPEPTDPIEPELTQLTCLGFFALPIHEDSAMLSTFAYRNGNLVACQHERTSLYECTIPEPKPWDFQSTLESWQQAERLPRAAYVAGPWPISHPDYQHRVSGIIANETSVLVNMPKYYDTGGSTAPTLRECRNGAFMAMYPGDSLAKITGGPIAPWRLDSYITTDWWNATEVGPRLSVADLLGNVSKVASWNNESPLQLPVAWNKPDTVVGLATDSDSLWMLIDKSRGETWYGDHQKVIDGVEHVDRRSQSKGYHADQWAPLLVRFNRADVGIPGLQPAQVFDLLEYCPNGTRTWTYGLAVSEDRLFVGIGGIDGRYRKASIVMTLNKNN